MIKKIIFALALSLLTGMSTYAQVVRDTSDTKDSNSDTTDTNFNIPVFSTTGADAESDMDQQDVSSLLQSSRDVFVQFASFQFSSARYRMRGYASENQAVMINGVNVNNLETGFGSWSNWGGLNDVTRFTESRFGNVGNRYGFTGPGGYTNIDSKASSFRKGTRISYSNGNRIFRNRVMVTHSTGLMQNGWALTLSASSRTGNQVYIPGTYFSANAFYASIDKRLNDKHSLSLTAYTAPIEQGRASAEQQEAYDLAGSNYYNSLWGYQNGKVRNSSVSKVNRPMFMLTETFKPTTNSRLNTTLYYNFGKSSLSSLNWNNSPNPRPDYYRYLPSYYYNMGDVDNGNILTQAWQNDPNTRQINWDRMIALNQNNLYTIPQQAGQTPNTAETRARYIVEDRVEDLKNIGLNSVYNARLDNLYISAGLNANVYQNRKYKIMDDLLGATYWLDYDQFAQNLGVTRDYEQNDIEHPDKKIYKGDKFGYDYSTNINRAEVWTQLEYTMNLWEFYGGVSISDSRVWREGYVANGKFPTDSKGSSDKLNFFNYGLKGGATYKLSGRQFLTANGTFMTRAPEVSNMFLSPRTRNQYIEGLQNENLLSGELSYHAKYPGFNFRFTTYYTRINNQVWLRSFWSDLYNNNVNYIMTGVDQTHQGVELAVEKTFFKQHDVQVVLGYGQYVYSNNPTAQAWQDNNNSPLFKDRTVYLKNYRIGMSPQGALGIGYKFNAVSHWYAGAYFNYFDGLYLEPNPDRRTQEAVSKYIDTDQQYKDITKQEKLPNFYTINLNAGKSLRINGKYYVNISLSINNLLNNKNIKVWGYEQLRWDVSQLSKFQNKYQYMQGTSYMANINFSF